MKRRQFLATCGVATSWNFLSPFNLLAEDASNLRPRLNRKLLQARNNNRSSVTCQNGIVCASQPLAAMAGIDILKAGGNCVDAAIGTNAMLGLTEPASCGIGGDLFAIIWIEKEGKLFGLNASGRSPYDWSLKRAQKLGLSSIPRQSPLSWSVPGCVSGWGELNKRFGKFNLAQCLDAAIHYGKTGFPISPIISEQFEFPPQMAPDLAKIYYPEGKPREYGEVLKNPLLTNSYQQIAKGGAEAYYQGDIAERIVARSKQLGGYMSMKDLQEHTATWVDPVTSTYRGWNVWELPPNGQGIAVLQILNMLENFDIGNLTPNSAEQLHLFVEAKKLAFEDRAQYYADPEFSDVPTEWLISKEYAKKRAKLIDPNSARQKVKFGDPALDSDTVYLAAADGEGNMISLIQSNYHGFGSTLCPEGVGFAIQNRGQSFSLDAQHRNRLESHKRPFHTIIPAFLTLEGRPVMPFGVMGGDFQPQGHAQVLMNMLDYGMSTQQAGDQPRVSHSGSSHPWGAKSQHGGSLSFEKGFDAQVKQTMSEMGHHVRQGTGVHGGYQAIWRLDNPRRYFGGSDPRKDGAAMGY
ncbi:MAG: gamma-glutamyltransferase [Pirellulales bacterium]